VEQGELKIGFVLVVGVDVDGDLRGFEPFLNILRKGIEVADNDVGQVLQTEKVASAAVSSQDRCRRSEIRPYPVDILYITVGKYQYGHSWHDPRIVEM